MSLRIGLVVIATLFATCSSTAQAADPLMVISAAPITETGDKSSTTIIRLSLENVSGRNISFSAPVGTFSVDRRAGVGWAFFETHILDERGEIPELTETGERVAKSLSRANYIIDLPNTGSLTSEIDLGSLYKLRSGRTYTAWFMIRSVSAALGTRGQDLPFQLSVSSAPLQLTMK